MRRLAPLALLLLVGCTIGPGGGLPGGRGRGGPPLPPAAQPTSVIATELAFARAAREEGQWAAYRRFAAPGAQVQWGEGSASAESWLAGRTNSFAPDRWLPREAWSSCDGSAVVVAGTSTDLAGNWSRYTRVWERQPGGTFRWAYTRSLPDPQLTRARQEREQQNAADEALGDDAIRVEAANFIRARVADCSAPAVLPTGDAPANSTGVGTGISKDRTLRWVWAGSAAASGSFVAYSWNGTGWDAVHSEPVAPSDD
jgi:hypothetical protein